MVSKSNTWTAKVVVHAEEDWGDEDARQSNDHEAQEGDEEDISISSRKSLLNINAPTFIQRNYPAALLTQKAVICKTGQQPIQTVFAAEEHIEATMTTGVTPIKAKQQQLLGHASKHSTTGQQQGVSSTNKLHGRASAPNKA